MIPLFKVLMSDDASHAVTKVLTSGYVAEGPKVKAFEAALAENLDAPPGCLLAVSSGTAALQLALHLAGVGPGDEVITTPQTCIATNVHIVHRGARPVWADIDPLTGCICPASVDRLRTGRTRAIIAVDWAGRLCDYVQLRRADPVIEDAAHAYMAGHPSRLRRGICGDYVCWSFQAIKHLTTGDGGALMIDCERAYRSELPARARRLRWFGLDRDAPTDFRAGADIAELGYKLHMNDIAAAIGLANLQGARRAVEVHRTNAAAYTELLGDLSPRVRLPPFDPDCSYWFFNLLVSDRESFQSHMRQAAIETSQVHARNDRISALRDFEAPEASLPGVDEFSAHQVAIPCGWWLTVSDVGKILEEVRAWAKS
jgi:dTDP-4-amino-4,6-dideoxygalactose transaminase